MYGWAERGALDACEHVRHHLARSWAAEIAVCGWRQEVRVSITGQGVVVRRAGAPAEVEEMVIEAPGPGEVLVRILASGVCHTDLHVKLGNMGDRFPYLLGHEGTAIVEAVGEGVERPAVGDTVILAWRAPCGQCRFCLLGQPSFCCNSLNAQPRMRAARDGAVLTPVLGIGTFCTHTVVAAGQAVPVPADLSPEATCLIGCGVMTGVGAVLYAANVRPGSTVAVFGCGGVGINVIQGARLAHAARVIAVDIEQRKLDWARQFGATDTVNATEGDPVARIRELTGGNGVNYAFEAIGRPETLLQALFCRDLAGTCVLIGVPGPTATLSIPLARYFDLGGSLRVTWYGDCLPTRDFPMLADWYRTGELKLDELVTRKIGLGDSEAAFAAMERGETLRSVMVMAQ
jgi:S-(hydroxymethyl)mycothiol dehydrogenase